MWHLYRISSAKPSLPVEMLSQIPHNEISIQNCVIGVHYGCTEEDGVFVNKRRCTKDGYERQPCLDVHQ
jgi:hypothetical protein